MTAEPWSKWFWTDYEADPGLRMSSLAAQGLWMRMLCLMAKATPKGELRVGSEPCTMADLAIYVGQPEETVAALAEELERRGVYSRTRAGVIYNRRLRKDAELSKKRAKAGAKGAAATNLKTNRNSDLPQQNAGNGSGKSPAPEARSQKPESPLPPRDGPPPDLAAVMKAGRFVSPPSDAYLLREWLALPDVRLERDIIPVVQRVAESEMQRSGRAPFKLKLFDAAVREKVAADAAEIARLNRISQRMTTQ
jgi:DNA-binding Lrp family transcriptional regulator